MDHNLPAGVVAVGNCVFHPVDLTLLNAKVSKARIGHAFSWHGLSGSLGWAAAPIIMVPIAQAYGWRSAFVVAGCLILVVTALLALSAAEWKVQTKPKTQIQSHENQFDFLKLPAVWSAFAFFLIFTVPLSGVQNFGNVAARDYYHLATWLVPLCLTAYMVGSALGMLVGGFVLARFGAPDKIIATGFVLAAVFALLLATGWVGGVAVPMLFVLMGFSAGLGSPSRDLLVRQAAPDGAVGRVYGMVYSGLDIGMAIAPLGFGWLMDHNLPAGVFIGIAVFQIILIGFGFNVSRYAQMKIRS
jgi:MFS family permease